MITTLNDQNFKKFIEESEKPVLVDFFATWCPPCSMLSPVIDKLSEDKDLIGEIVFAKMDIDKSPDITRQFKVEQVPTVILFRNKEAIADFLGFMPQDAVKDWILGSLKN
jgi:thioredoxin